MFDTTKEDLLDLIKDIDKGLLQLPDFQRDYVWGDEDVRSLIESVAKGFPVGALLTLETGGEVRFKPRLLEGVPDVQVEPNGLLLDGQQRMTSLYQSFYSDKPVKTLTPRGTMISRYYYIDIKMATQPNANFEQAIVGVPEDKITRKDFGRTVVLDLSSETAEFDNDMFPLNQVLDSRDWLYNWRDYWNAKDRNVSALDREFVNRVIRLIERYKLPIIKLDKENGREAICLVFEKVNVGGKKLDAFELLTAIYAADNFDLREDWNGSNDPKQVGRRARIVGTNNRLDVLTDIASIDFLQACTLLHTHEARLNAVAKGLKGNELPQITCRRDAILELPLEAYKKFSIGLEKGMIEAGIFLNEMKIIWHKDIPYPPLVVGLAATFAVLERNAQTAAAKKKLAQWFWSVTLGELYGSATDTRLSRDLPDLVEWIEGSGDEPRSLDDAFFQQERLLSLRTRVSAAYKGLHALLMQYGCRDFITGRETQVMTFFNDQIDIHHIFPKHWCEEQGIEPKVFNSIVNKTPLSKASNIAIGGQAPSAYLAKIEDKHGLSSEQLDEILKSHLIEPDLLRTDDFKGFFNARMEALSSLISDAMGKPVVREEGSNEPEIEPNSANLNDAKTDYQEAQ